MQGVLHAVNDWQLRTVLLLLVADFIFGVLAALKTKTFDLGRVADTLRDDVLWKVLPYITLAAFAWADKGDIVIPGLDWSVLAHGAWVVAVAALVKSLLDSFTELGLPLPQIQLGGSSDKE